ncbi:MAG: hypothetical protein GY870_17185, partial [archaeon]|nr:hypothetical protein [archaeon]
YDILAENDTLKISSGMTSFVKGTYRIEVISIDEKTFTYYNQLNDIRGGGMGGSTPYNPHSNFGEEVMGYFTAWSFVEDSGVLD